MPTGNRKSTKKHITNQATASKYGDQFNEDASGLDDNESGDLGDNSASEPEAHEWRLQDTDYPSTFGYHEHRERVAHLEQPWHASRLYRAAKLVRVSGAKTCVDLGCGDGGLLSVVQAYGIKAWGYDFCPANASGWPERGVSAELRDVFNDRPQDLQWGECAVVTEVLEHLADPHGAVEWIAQNAKFIVASSPWGERPGGGPCDSHIWGWDLEGYRAMIGKYFDVLDHRKIDWSQVLLGKRRS